VEWMDEDVLKVTWIATNLSEILGYQVLYGTSTSDVDTWRRLEVGVTETLVIIPGLNRELLYSAAVCARLNSNDVGPLSEIRTSDPFSLAGKK